MKARHNINEALVNSWIRQGLGQGYGDKYQPLHSVQDVPSVGEGWKVPVLFFPDREHPHQYLSFLEKSTGCILEREDVIQIREQFACLCPEGTRDETIAIADNLGVRHPKYPGTRTPIIISTDVVATCRDGSTLAVYCKPDELLDPATEVGRDNLAKKAIEEAYWSRRRNTTFLVATESTYPDALKENVVDARSCLFQVEHHHLLPRMAEAIELFLKSWTRFRTLFQIQQALANRMGLNNPEAAFLVYAAAWHKRLPIDLRTARVHPRNLVRML